MFSIAELVDFLFEKGFISEKLLVNGEKRVGNFSSLTNPKKSSLCWAKRLLAVEDVPNCAVLICLPDQQWPPQLKTLLIHVDEPRRAFGAIVEKFCPEKEMTGISPSAEIHSSVRLGQNVYVGAKCVIGENCEIGDHTRIDANVTIYDHVKIGERCHISSGAVIGADGHGYYLDENKSYKKIRHLGGVLIGDDVDIGANSCVDRGILDDTVVGNNTKINNLAHIAHNVVVGENCIITAGVVLAGGSVIGSNCWIAPGAILRNGVLVANEVQVGMNSVVNKSIEESNVVVIGSPAKIIKSYKI